VNGEGADILDDIVVVCAPDFAAESKGVPAFEPTQGVVQNCGRIAASLGLAIRSPEKQCFLPLVCPASPLPPEEPAGRVMLNFAGSSSAFGRKVKWILLNPIRNRIGKRSVKGVILADRQQLPESIAGIPESRNSVQDRRDQRLLPKVFRAT